MDDPKKPEAAAGDIIIEEITYKRLFGDQQHVIIEQRLVDIEEDHLGLCHRSVPPLTQHYNARCSEVASRCSAHVLATHLQPR